MKKVLFALCLVAFSGSAFAALPVPHILSGSVIYTGIPGHAADVIQENVNIEFYNLSACNGAKSSKEHGAFSPVADVTGAAIFPEKITKYVNLQCLPKL